MKYATVVLVLILSLSGIRAEETIKALLITGGCCHDYPIQKTLLSNGISLRSKVPVEWTIIHYDKDTKPDVKIDFYKNPKWAEGYDIVVHNECWAAVGHGKGGDEFVRGIIKPHRDGLPAVLVHCTMHSYRTGESKEEWFELCGVHSPKHGSHHPFEVEIIKSDHEIMEGLSNWTTPKGELYFIAKTYPGITPLAQSKSNDDERIHPNIWVNEYGPNKTRIFGTTIGHHNETMADPNYLNMITRGLLWAAGKDLKTTFKKVD